MMHCNDTEIWLTHQSSEGMKKGLHPSDFYLM